VTFKRAKGLTIPQRNAIDLLVTGLTDPTVAQRVGVSRTTVTKWRLYDPLFQAALNHQRRVQWSGASDGLRAVLPAAIDAMREELRVGPNRGRLALDLVTRAGVMGKPYSGALANGGPTDMQSLLDEEVLRQRATFGDASSDTAGTARPITEKERDAAYEYLLAQLDSETDEPYDSPTETPVTHPGSVSPAS